MLYFICIMHVTYEGKKYVLEHFFCIITFCMLFDAFIFLLFFLVSSIYFKMITLTRKLKKESTQRNEPSTTSTNNYNTSTSLSTSKRISIRDQLLVKDIQEMEQNMPCTCRIDFTGKLINIWHFNILLYRRMTIPVKLIYIMRYVCNTKSLNSCMRIINHSNFMQYHFQVARVNEQISRLKYLLIWI